MTTGRKFALLFATVSLTLITVLAVASGPSQAAQPSCPDGFVPSETGTGCVSAPAEGGQPDQNDTITASCTQGVLSDDGTQCLVPRLDAAPAGDVDATTSAPIPTFTG